MVTDKYATGSWNYLKQLSDNGARIISMSWYSSCSFLQPEQDAVNEIYANGTVLVAAAGNSTCGSTYAKVYPASYENVIAVSGVGHYRDIGDSNTTNVKDVHYQNYALSINRLQNNEDVDLVAPAYVIFGLASATGDTHLSVGFIGTSMAAPIVSGSLALIFSSNNCLSPIEAETILKLTSANIDQLPPNQPFAGLLGAGRLDAGKANKMAWHMNPINGGEVLIEGKSFNRWNFELISSPESIKIQNQSFTDSSNIIFRAKKAITLDVNTLLKPGTGKSHLLYAENTDTCSNFNKSYNPSGGKKGKTSDAAIKTSSLKLYPNPSKDYINIQTDEDIQRLEVFDMSGKLLKTGYSKKISILDLPKGNYLIKAYAGKNVETSKFTKD